MNHFTDTKSLKIQNNQTDSNFSNFEELEDKFNETNDILNTLFEFLEVKSVNEFQKKWQKSVEETENLLSKNKVLEQIDMCLLRFCLSH